MDLHTHMGVPWISGGQTTHGNNERTKRAMCVPPSSSRGPQGPVNHSLLKMSCIRKAKAQDKRRCQHSGVAKKRHHNQPYVPVGNAHMHLKHSAPRPECSRTRVWGESRQSSGMSSDVAGGHVKLLLASPHMEPLQNRTHQATPECASAAQS